MDLDLELKFLARNPVDVFLDVGANTGQTGLALRKAGYAGRIISFETIRECYDRLASRAAGDPDWDVRHTALGAHDGTARIGVSGNLVSSSILPATDRLIELFEPIRYTRHEEVPLARLDSLLPDLLGPGKTAHLKIDTQGFERFVIEGARDALDRIRSLRMEIAVTEVYEGEMVMPEAITMMRGLGYVLVEIWPAWRHPQTRDVLQFDLLFRRDAAGQAT